MFHRLEPIGLPQDVDHPYRRVEHRGSPDRLVAQSAPKQKGHPQGRGKCGTNAVLQAQFIHLRSEESRHRSVPAGAAPHAGPPDEKQFSARSLAKKRHGNASQEDDAAVVMSPRTHLLCISPNGSSHDQVEPSGSLQTLTDDFSSRLREQVAWRTPIEGVVGTRRSRSRRKKSVTLSPNVPA
jgi:hypothetical protein